MIRKGFTLIELLVVIAIIAILAILLTVNLSNARKKARDAKRQSDMTTVQTALSVYNDENGKYPVVPNLAPNKSQFDTMILAIGTGITAAPKDPGTYEYRYGATPTGNSYKLQWYSEKATPPGYQTIEVK